MHTDKQVYQLFKYCPEKAFELAGIQARGPYHLESVAVKALERTTDGLLRSESPDEPLTLMEVQFQRDASIYNRLVLTMAQIQQEHDFRSVRGIIFFATRPLDPQTQPWAETIRVVYLDEVLREREARMPQDPIVAVFKPVLEDDAKTLESEAAKHYRCIQTSGLAERQIDALSEVFVSWLLERFQNKNAQDLAMILDLPSIKDTRAGREIYEEGIGRGREVGREEGREVGREEGHDEGLEEAVITVLESRIGGALETELVTAIKALPLAELRVLLRESLTMTSSAEAAARVRALGGKK